MPARTAPSGDDGFSLIEAVVALAIATAMFTALAFALVGGVKSALLSQQNQQAGDVLNKAVEDARSLSYASLRMRATDLNIGEVIGAGRTPAMGTCLCYDPNTDTTSGPNVEPLWPTDPNGGIDVHVKSVVQNGGTFTVRRYITKPMDASSAVYKRLTVVVTWNGLGKLRTLTYTTLVAETKRGLPLPDFKFTNADTLSQCRNPGSQMVYTFTIKNNGARDSWATTASPIAPGWFFYADTNGSGAYEVLSDVALPAATGTPATGLLEPTTSSRFFAVQTLSLAAPPYTATTTFRATSVAQPSYFQELTAVTAVQSGPCGAVAVPSSSAVPTVSLSPSGSLPTAPAASCATLQTVSMSAPGGTLVRYYPGNSSIAGNTVAQNDMPMTRDGGALPAAGSLYNYSTDLHSVAGRAVSGVAATWLYNVPAASELKGNGEVTFWAATPSGSTTDTPVFKVTLERLNSAGVVQVLLDTATFSATSGWGCAGFRPVSVPLAGLGNSITISANAKLRLRVQVTNGVPMRLAYATAAYPMTMTLPYKTGLG